MALLLQTVEMMGRTKQQYSADTMLRQCRKGTDLRVMWFQPVAKGYRCVVAAAIAAAAGPHLHALG